MARGDYTVQEVEAAKQEGRDSSYRACVLTMFIFLVLCIILLVIGWTTWKPASEKDAYAHHSVSLRKRHVFIIICMHQLMHTIYINLQIFHIREISYMFQQ
jgi:magnesium-transporting ATPase (P-type)